MVGVSGYCLQALDKGNWESGHDFGYLDRSLSNYRSKAALGTSGIHADTIIDSVLQVLPVREILWLLDRRINIYRGFRRQKWTRTNLPDFWTRFNMAAAHSF
jgi:hypothetical protein